MFAPLAETLRHQLFRRLRRLDGDNVLVFHIAKGQVTEVWVMSTNPYAGDEFWA